MSVEINWDKLTSVEAEKCAYTLQRLIDSRELPNWILFLRVTDFQWGQTAPEVELKDITDPMPFFYTIANHHHSHQLPTQPSSNLQPNNYDYYHHFHEQFENSSHYYERDQVDFAPAQNQSGENNGMDGSPQRTPSPSKSIFTSGFPANQFHNAKASPSSSLAHDVKSESVSPCSSENPAFFTAPPIPPPIPRTPNPLDTQIVFQLNYNGDLSVGIESEIAVNTPSPCFISLPVKMRITHIKLKATVSIVYLGSKIIFCILKDSEPEFELSFKTEWEVGDPEKPPVLRNASKIEQFLHEFISALIQETMIYPNFITKDLLTSANIDLDGCID